MPGHLFTETRENEPQQPPAAYKGFVAGAFSGVAKLSVGHPFDTIKVRLQTSPASHFRGPVDCLLQTLRHEGVTGVYKGATPPLIGWVFMDSVMLGSRSLYRRMLSEKNYFLRKSEASVNGEKKLSVLGEGIAGMFAGWTVSFVAAPVEHVKARLQIQYSADKSTRLYSGPVDCSKKLLKAHGLPGLYKGLYSTMLFRTFFLFWWGSYDIFSEALKDYSNLSSSAINFWAGGLSAQVFWITSYPADVIKQKIMTDSFGSNQRYPRWRDAATSIWRENGWRGYWRGFLPCFLRAFPANAMALFAFEGVMKTL